MVCHRKREILRFGLWIIFLLYIIALTYFLFFSERFGRVMGEEYRYNLKFFHEIKRFIKYREQLGNIIFLTNIVGNVVAFVPFGFLLPCISKVSRKFLNVVMLGFELTLSIEIMQLLLKVGAFDVDDIIMNLTGTIIGYAVFKIMYFIVDKITERKHHNKER